MNVAQVMSWYLLKQSFQIQIYKNINNVAWRLGDVAYFLENIA